MHSSFKKKNTCKHRKHEQVISLSIGFFIYEMGIIVKVER